MTPQEAHNLARQKARYGHQDWIVWTDKTGAGHAERLTASSMKACLLDCGTKKGSWTLVCKNDGTGMVGFWWLGLNLIQQCKRGQARATAKPPPRSFAQKLKPISKPPTTWINPGLMILWNGRKARLCSTSCA